MTGRVIIAPCSQPKGVYLLDYAGERRSIQRGGPSDRTVASVIRSILVVIVFLPFALGSVLTFALLLAGGFGVIRTWIH